MANSRIKIKASFFTKKKVSYDTGHFMISEVVHDMTVDTLQCTGSDDMHVYRLRSDVLFYAFD